MSGNDEDPYEEHRCWCGSVVCEKGCLPPWMKKPVIAMHPAPPDDFNYQEIDLDAVQRPRKSQAATNALLSDTQSELEKPGRDVEKTADREGAGEQQAPLSPTQREVRGIPKTNEDSTAEHRPVSDLPETEYPVGE